VGKHHTWVALGRHREGPVANAMRKARCEYKLMLKHKRTQAQSCFTKELHESLMDKDYSSFWRSWNAKFGHAIGSQVINGTSDHGSIAEAFGDIFDACCQPKNNMAHERLKQQFEHMYDGYCGAAFDVESSINVELVDRAIRDLKLGRAAGPDGICAEHLVYCHPSVCVLLSLLFRLMFMTDVTPAILSRDFDA